MGKNVAIMIERPDGNKDRIAVPGGKDMLASEIAEWLEDYLNKHPQVLKEEVLEEGADVPTNIKIGDVVKTKEGTLKILNITLGSFHKKEPLVFVEYEYDVFINGKKIKDKEKQLLSFFRKMF